MFKKIYITALMFLLVAASLFSLNSTVKEKNDIPFNLNLALDSSIIVTAAGLNGAAFYWDKVRKENYPDFDEHIFDPSQVNKFDQLLMNPYSATIDDLGTYMGIIPVLTPSVLLAAPLDHWLTIGIIYTETMALAYGVKELGKLSVNRARPFMYYDGFPQEAIDDHDWNKSFPSGHTTLAFAGATFTSFVFSQYFPDSRWKIPIIGSSYLAAFGTAACRVASGNHFLSDVIIGAIAGTSCGFFVPWIHGQIIKTIKSDNEGMVDIAVQVIPGSIILSLKY